MKFTDFLTHKFDPVREAWRVKRLNRLIEGTSKYDVFGVSTDTNDWAQIAPRLPLFDAIGKMIEETGHRAFMPHRFCFSESGVESLGPRDAYILVNEMMVPKTSLFLGYVGYQSTFVGSMIGQAMLKRKKVVFFYEEGTRLETVADVKKLVIGGRGLDNEKDREILVSPHIFYHHAHPNRPLRPYKYLEGVVRFESVEECVEKLRPKIVEILDS